MAICITKAFFAAHPWYLLSFSITDLEKFDGLGKGINKLCTILLTVRTTKYNHRASMFGNGNDDYLSNIFLPWNILCTSK